MAIRMTVVTHSIITCIINWSVGEAVILKTELLMSQSRSQCYNTYQQRSSVTQRLCMYPQAKRHYLLAYADTGSSTYFPTAPHFHCFFFHHHSPALQSAMSAFTSPGEFDDAYTTLFRTFASGRTKDLAWRKWQLKQVWWMFDENEAAILAALKSDLNRGEFESYLSDVRGVREEVLRALKNIDKWAADDIPDAGFIFGTLAGARIKKEPLGVALIIGAWNFPVLLIIKPMIAAIAAGCCVMLKPSELSRATQNLFAELVPKYLDPSAIRVVTGGPHETQEILKRRFNHIFFTGSNKIAKFVTEAAAKHLTPTVLELGGQGPAVVTAKANVDLAAKRIAYVKYMNAGQICLSVNHVFVDPSVHDEFVERLGFWFNTFIAEKPENMVRIVNERNWDRLTGLLDRSNGKLVHGGKKDRDIKYLEPTIMTDIGYDGRLD
jgi:aldehyde dehydrogenase (NAD+)